MCASFSSHSPHRRLRFIGLIAVLFACGNALAQSTQCTVKLSELPHTGELKGFWLGMTTEQVKARVPQIVFGPTDKLGVAKTSINPAYDPRGDQSSFQDVRTVSLDFLDGRLVSLWIGYDRSFKWTTVEDFVAGISRSLALPNSWSPWKLRGQQMRCTDFQLIVSMIAGSPSFRILDQGAEETLTTRRQAQEDETSSQVDRGEETMEIVGDSHTRTYYPSSCRTVPEIAVADRVVFKTSAEAEKAGYKSAKHCE
jgi:hypothetical protein